MAEGHLYPRFAERPLIEALDDSRVVLLHSPRLDAIVQRDVRDLARISALASCRFHFR